MRTSGEPAAKLGWGGGGFISRLPREPGASDKHSRRVPWARSASSVEDYNAGGGEGNKVGAGGEDGERGIWGGGGNHGEVRRDGGQQLGMITAPRLNPSPCSNSPRSPHHPIARSHGRHCARTPAVRCEPTKLFPLNRLWYWHKQVSIMQVVLFSWPAEKNVTRNVQVLSHRCVSAEKKMLLSCR